MKTIEGLRVARLLGDRLRQRGYPVRKVFLFGSVAHGTSHKDSDIDIAVFCEPFKARKHLENVRFLLEAKKIDMRIQTVCLHPKDFANPFFTLAREVQEHGIEV